MKRSVVKLLITLFLMLITLLSSAHACQPQPISGFLPQGTTSHFIQVNGIRLHYLELGQGPLIILLHGWPETSASWHLSMEPLARHHHVVAPDLRGLGASERTTIGYDKKTIATDIHTLISALGYQQAIIIGHDMGGKTAYVMAHLYPQSVSKLVLVDCLIPGTENTDALHGGAWHYGFHMEPDIPELLTQGREKAYIKAMIENMSFQKKAISEAMINEYVSHYATPGGMTAGFNYYRALKQDAALVDTFRGKPLTMPVMTISGRHGVAEQLPRALTKEAPTLQAVIVNNSGHFVAEETPAIFNTAVLQFLANS